MKSKHLAKADFLRRLRELARELYELGDFTSEDPKRELVSAKIQGFADAGTTIEVVSSGEVQQVIDQAHFAKFNEDREARRARILEERANNTSVEDNTSTEAIDWEIYDSPAKDRRQ